MWLLIIIGFIIGWQHHKYQENKRIREQERLEEEKDRILREENKG